MRSQSYEIHFGASGDSVPPRNWGHGDGQARTDDRSGIVVPQLRGDNKCSQVLRWQNAEVPDLNFDACEQEMNEFIHRVEHAEGKRLRAATAFGEDRTLAGKCVEKL